MGFRRARFECHAVGRPRSVSGERAVPRPHSTAFRCVIGVCPFRCVMGGSSPPTTRRNRLDHMLGADAESACTARRQARIRRSSRTPITAAVRAPNVTCARSRAARLPTATAGRWRGQYAVPARPRPLSVERTLVHGIETTLHVQAAGREHGLCLQRETAARDPVPMITARGVFAGRHVADDVARPWRYRRPCAAVGHRRQHLARQRQRGPGPSWPAQRAGPHATRGLDRVRRAPDIELRDQPQRRPRAPRSGCVGAVFRRGPMEIVREGRGSRAAFISAGHTHRVAAVVAET